MKLLRHIFVVILLVSAAGIASAQSDGGQGQGHQEKNRFQRLEKFRKMRLVEALNLNEEDAVRFTAKHNAHEEIVQKLMDERNQALDDMDAGVKAKKPGKELRDAADRVLDIDKKIFEERRRYQEDMRGMFTPEQFARFLVFERNFGRQVRNAIEEMHEHSGGRGE
jgi:hypothetical protein